MLVIEAVAIQVSPLVQASGYDQYAPPYLQEVGDTPSRTCILVYRMDLNDTAPSRYVLRGHSHRERVSPGAVTDCSGDWG